MESGLRQPFTRDVPGSYTSFVPCLSLPKSVLLSMNLGAFMTRKLYAGLRTSHRIWERELFATGSPTAQAGLRITELPASNS